MADYSSYKETSNRHLRFKLQSLSRRLDELEEATRNLQKAEDELLDLQDKVIQAEGSNSSMLADVEALRKRVLKIEGKDEEIRKAEELCQLMKAKLEEEESLTRELKSEIERLQKRMAELEKLEEAFGRSKNDCTQLCLSLNEEKNLTKKISTELEVLRAKVKELEQSEDRLDKTEQSLVSELEKLKSLALVFVSERKHFTEKEKQNEKLIQELTQQLEQNNKLNRADQTRNTSNLLERSSNSIIDRNDLRIEVDLTTSALSSKETRRKASLDYLKLVENEARNKSENQKNKNQEDNKVKDLNQEIEKLKTQIKHFESLEEELKTLRAKNNDLHDNYLSEQNKNKILVGQLEEIKMQMKKQKELENGEAEMEEVNLPSRVKHDRPKHRTVTAESAVSKHKSRELSPQHRRERLRNRELNNECYGQGSKRVTSPNMNSRRAAKTSSTSTLLDTLGTDAKRVEDKTTLGMNNSPPKDSSTSPAEVKKCREQPPVLSRYPPAAQEHKSWKVSSKPKSENTMRNRVEKVSQPLNDAHHVRPDELEDQPSKPESVVPSSERGLKMPVTESLVLATETRTSKVNCGPSNGAALSYGQYLSGETLTSEPVGLKMETTVSARRQHLEEGSQKTFSFQDRESMDPPLEITKSSLLSKSWLISRSQEDLLQSHPIPQKEEIDQTLLSTVNCNSLDLKATVARSKAVNPSWIEKSGNSEGTSKIGNISATFDLGIKKEIAAREFTSSKGSVHTLSFENDRNASSEEDLSRQSKMAAAGAMSGLKSRRPFSPREALRSKAVIKPAIVEKDVKEIMGGVGSGLETSFEKQHPTCKTVAHKMTSSITIYPSEPIISRSNTTDATREQLHATVGSVQIIPNELSPGADAASIPNELSLNKSSITLKLPETDKNGDPVLRSRVETVISKSSITIKPSETTEKNSEPPMETGGWKSHSTLGTHSSETKHVTVRSSWRTRRGLHPLEDSAAKVVEHANPRTPCRSSTDPSKPEGMTARIYAIEQNSRRASARINSWNTPELDSRRTKSSLSASEMLSQKSCVSDLVTASPWNCTVMPEDKKDFAPSSRRKTYGSSEQLTPRKRPEIKVELPRQFPSSRAEERRRWSRDHLEAN
ncbi:leucine zipper protein 1 [Python bivittatus]|uniref:Leucine zipper protein 1 n=1 Tax=Python bivittatus TaxID=176946 RepID=A0A9F2QXV3_PYTBI|nr:leucine zipper protein 1 [Python bivittatus]XP_007430029.1 leucine zipper protein 1 [Python bivittatus]